MENGGLLFDETIKNVEFYYRFSGINIKSRDPAPSDYLKSLIIYIINFICLNSVVAGQIYWCIDGIRTGQDFLSLTCNAPCIIIALPTNLKCMQLVLNEKKLQELIKNLRNMERRTNKENMEDRIKIINKEKGFLDTVIKMINRLYLVVLLMFACPPLIIMLVKYINTGEVELRLPFLVMYPFDSFKLKFWPFAYIHQFWAECLEFSNVLAADYFFFICCTYLRIQFKLLQHEIENIIPVQKGSRKFFEDSEFKAKFRELIRWHQDLIESTQILETIYSIPTLLNFLSSSFLLCLTGFNVTMVDDVEIVVAFLGFLLMSLFQVLFICFFADLLTSASEEITSAVYNSQWYMAEVSVGKKMLILQTRAIKPCKLTAYGFADVNLNSFMRVLSTSWSYFALLQNVYEN